MPVRRNRRPRLLVGIVALFGGVVLALGLHYLLADVTCGDAVMAPGDICEGTRGGEVTDRIAYEDLLSDQQIGGYALTGFGALVVLSAVVMLWFGRGRRSPQRRQS